MTSRQLNPLSVHQFKANLTDSVMLKACYSNFSSVDRPWRKFNDIISVSMCLVNGI